ncbi:MAG: 16S rRNA (cytosine(1402)-N(4))-methyltransferase RsmH [Puniceicoccales bacterium]|jgi:16S rRNA (cytosine1402-N4)-methyltransferase|nr:16S rRNA (cytosine(1402)-N(4))-methyltransferase RsmH [Puniceicoccales bacterium]
MNVTSPVERALEHVPVMRSEVCEFLRPEQAGVFLDMSFGAGGHARAILEAHAANELWAMDRDPEAEARALSLAKAYPGRFHFQRRNFSTVDALPPMTYDGVLMDLGLSSLQLDDPRRGFSFRHSTLLDMRMDPNTEPSAADFLATASREQLVEAIRDFGEERHWKSIVGKILSHRGRPAVERSDLLAELVISCYPLRERFGRIHPATKTFQGIRIAVNRELSELQEALPKVFQRLRAGGRLVVLSFHSLEDRIVKNFFREKATESRSESPAEAPLKAEALLLTKKSLRPSREEVARNPRSRSAKLRALERI